MKYIKSFLVNDKPKKVIGFQEHNKLQIINAIFGKFLSIPKTQNEKLDFVDFLKLKIRKVILVSENYFQ